MKDKDILFEEKQYLGYNKYSLIRRMVIAVFCFLAYFFSDNIEGVSKNEPSGNLLFFMGIAILIISALLVFTLHMHTKIIPGSIIIDGLWTARRVKISLSDIVSAKKIKYSKYLLNRPVYNLHKKGKIIFYTRGNEAIELQDKDGIRYIIGTQQPDLFLQIVKNQLKNK
ncbi:MAG: hypothetical protein D6707_00605 [Bacteroidetes bacterium]|nr:MAG: hypothetical protein D6707_00605 [Bacteroidota bacterium]